MAGTALKEISKDEHERAKRRSQRMFETDYTNDILVSRDEGYTEGKAEGKAEGAEMLAKLIKEGIPLDDALKNVLSTPPQ